MQFFVLRVASNKEDRVREALVRKVKIEGLDDLIGRIIVPTERIKRVKQGQQKVAERKLYPGYVFVEMELNNDGTIPERSYYLFKDTQGVGDFIGQRNKPDEFGQDLHGPSLHVSPDRTVQCRLYGDGPIGCNKTRVVAT